MICTHCGANNSGEALFCQKCGTKFETVREDESTVLTPQSEYPYVNSPYTIYNSLEPIYPPPPPDIPYVSISNSDKLKSPLRPRNSKWYMIIIAVLLLMLISVGFFEVGQLVKSNSQANRGNPQNTVPINGSTAITNVTPASNQISSTQVDVQASDWQNSGVAISQGAIVTITYISGTWNPWPGANFDGNGCTQGCDPVTANVIVGCNHGSLIGRIGNAQLICILDGKTVTANESGMLYLRINDKALSDDSGALTVRITLG